MGSGGVRGVREGTAISGLSLLVYLSFKILLFESEPSASFLPMYPHIPRPLVALEDLSVPSLSPRVTPPLGEPLSPLSTPEPSRLPSERLEGPTPSVPTPFPPPLHGVIGLSLQDLEESCGHS